MPISRDLGFFSLSGRVKTDKWPLELARPPGQGRRLSLAAGPRRLLSRASGSQRFSDARRAGGLGGRKPFGGYKQIANQPHGGLKFRSYSAELKKGDMAHGCRASFLKSPFPPPPRQRGVRG